MRYTASSVKRALEGMISTNGWYSGDLKDMKCPIVSLIVGEGSTCPGGLKNCVMVGKETCRRCIRIYKSNSPNIAPFSILTFYYPISPTNSDGYISCQDSALKLLIDGGYISEADLTVV